MLNGGHLEKLSCNYMTAIFNSRTHARKMAAKYDHVQLHDMGIPGMPATPMGYTPGCPLLPLPPPLAPGPTLPIY